MNQADFDQAIGRLKQLAAPSERAPATAAAPEETPRNSWTLRRWESAETNRLNSAHWKKVNGQSINVDLMMDLVRLRTRAAYEVSNNPTLEGVLNTYSTDVAGRNGPTLQVQCDDEGYAVSLEAVWRDFWKSPELTGRLGGVDWLKLNLRSLWINGEFLSQKVTSARAVRERSPIAMRLKVIHPRRLGTPAERTGEHDLVLGVRQTVDGEPLEYMISDPLQMGPFRLDQLRYTPVPAASVIHRFIMIEEDQARGVPWLATPLQSVGDMRDYDVQVLDAARQAAANAVFLSTDHPDANYIDVGAEVVDIERAQIQTLPPGWKPSMMQPTQPMGNYVEYRSERLRDIGRPVGMPLMMVRLDSSGHNYSSARFDGQIYLRGLQAMQGWLERRSLNELLEDVRREAQLYALANPRWEHAAALRRVVKFEAKWTWPVPPHVDPKKEADAERTKLENGTLPYADACSANGMDEDTVIASRARTNKKLLAAGLPPLPVANQGGGGAAGGAVDPQTISDLRDAADAAEEKGDQDTADSLNDQADQLEAASSKSQNTSGAAASSPAAMGPAGLNGAQITAMVDVVSKLKDGTISPEAAVELLAAGGLARESAETIVAKTTVLVKDASAEQVAFKRTVVGKFLDDHTTNDVIYNLADIPDLLVSSGLKLDPAVEKDPQKATPYIPVVSDPGPLVSGDVIKDPAGDIVGGDVIEPEASVEPPANPPGKAKVEDVAGGADEQNKDDETKPPASAAAA